MPESHVKNEGRHVKTCHEKSQDEDIPGQGGGERKTAAFRPTARPVGQPGQRTTAGQLQAPEGQEEDKLQTQHSGVSPATVASSLFPKREPQQ